MVDDAEIKKQILPAFGVPSGGYYIINSANKVLVMTYRNDLQVGGRKYNDWIQSASACVQIYY